MPVWAREREETPMVRIRMASSHDIRAMAEIRHACYLENPSLVCVRSFPETDERSKFSYHLRGLDDALIYDGPNGNRLMVAEQDDGTILGFATSSKVFFVPFGGDFSTAEHSEARSNMYGLYVAPEARCQGVGRALTKAMLRLTLEEPANWWPATADVHVGNEPVRALLASIGMEPASCPVPPPDEKDDPVYAPLLVGHMEFWITPEKPPAWLSTVPLPLGWRPPR